jgi:hypothetical protein
VFPESVTGTLDAEAAKTTQKPGTLTIVSTDTLSAEQMSQARLLAATR